MIEEKSCRHPRTIFEAMKREIVEDAVGGVIQPWVRSLKDLEKCAELSQYGVAEKSEALAAGHGFGDAHALVDAWLATGVLKDVKVVPFGDEDERSRAALLAIAESILGCAATAPDHPLMGELVRATRRRPRAIVRAAEALKRLLG